MTITEKSSGDLLINEPRKNSILGNIILILTGGTAIGLSVICYPFISPALRRICLPYVPASSRQISNVLLALKGRSGKLLDIGSGDGRIVLAGAKAGFDSYGVELNHWLVAYSKWKAFTGGLNKSATFFRKDLWKFNLQPYNNIVIFGVEEMMVALDEKLKKELKDCFVVACRFPIPNRTPLRTIGTGLDTVWLYHFHSE